MRRKLSKYGMPEYLDDLDTDDDEKVRTYGSLKSASCLRAKGVQGRRHRSKSQAVGIKC